VGYLVIAKYLGEKLVAFAEIVGTIGEGLSSSTENESQALDDVLESRRREARMEARYEGFLTKAEEIIRAVRMPVVLCGVTIHPEYDAEAKKIGFYHMGGKATLLSHDVRKRFTFDVDVPMKSFTLKAWGGCVVSEVLMGNQSQLIGHYDNGISEGTFGAIGVGSRITVEVKLPFEQA